MLMLVLFWLSVVILFYVYIGYPLLVALFAQLKPKSNYHLDELPSISLIIAAFNEEAIMEKKFEHSGIELSAG
jgi:cellulose synthase/poly-beta-1,6-N-acetylglucosamine synthase-like glycosyltransferase